MIEKIQKAIDDQIPVDIYLRISVDGQPVKCMLYYSAFIILNMDSKKGTFIGYTLENRHKKPNEKILTEELINLVCNIQSPELI